MKNEPTNGELALQIAHILEKVTDMHEISKEENIPKRVAELEFWRKAIIWGASAVVSVGLFIGSTAYNYAINDITDKIEVLIDDKIRVAFDDLVIEEVE